MTTPNYAYFVVVLYVLAVVLPLIPAVVIYWLFPNTPVTTSGVLSGITFKAGGAFAAYVVVFLLTAVSWNKTFGSLHSLISESWTIRGRLEVHDVNDQKVSDPDVLKSVKITFDPDITHSRGGHFDVHVPVVDNDIPGLTFSIGDGATSEWIDFSDPGNYKITTDLSKNLKTIATPVVIKLLPAQHPYQLNQPMAPLPASQTRPVVEAGGG